MVSPRDITSLKDLLIPVVIYCMCEFANEWASECAE